MDYCFSRSEKTFIWTFYLIKYIYSCFKERNDSGKKKIHFDFFMVYFETGKTFLPCIHNFIIFEKGLN